MTPKSPEELEEEHLPRDSKEWRRARKEVRARDRSGSRVLPRRNVEGRQLGRVLSVTARGYEVDGGGVLYVCTIRRTHLQQRRQAKGLVTVGDLVYFSPGALSSGAKREGVIEEIKERYSVLQRADSLQARRQHLIAANIDQVLITVSVGSPPLKPALIDRYLIAAQKGKMTPIVVINKIDLVARKELTSVSSLYTTLGYRVLLLSAQTGDGLAALCDVMRDKASVFAGQSGVGKSSLINAVTGLTLPVGEVTRRTKKGAHTTSHSRLIRLPTGGWCIDTPGIKSFGLWRLHRREVATFFPELEALRSECYYPNCSHTHEPHCAVLTAVENGAVSSMRYESYLTLLHEAGTKPRRR